MHNANLNPTKEQQQKAHEKVIDVFLNDKDLYNRARALQNEIGLGGLWKGTDTTLLVIIEALESIIS
jgi:hypothetical protein